MRTWGEATTNGNTARIYRVAEPMAGRTRGALQSTVFGVFPIAHNVEAMYVAADGAIVLITKVAGTRRRRRRAATALPHPRLGVD
jgi:hypothetical protein